MEAPAVSRLFLAVPATCILLLLLEYIRRNRGTATAAAFAAACLGYGMLRAIGVFLISESHGVPMPYRMTGSIRIGAASPMELAGWMLATALAWQAGATPTQGETAASIGADALASTAEQALQRWCELGGVATGEPSVVAEERDGTEPPQGRLALAG